MQIKGLDVTFLMHIIVEVFVIVQYSRNEKNRKFKKNENRKNGPKWQISPNFFQAYHSMEKTKKQALLN